jgi:response regulator of citrate/malate metabolism
MPVLDGIISLKFRCSSTYDNDDYNEFALETYELDVLDYLVKPIEFPRFMKAINKVDKEAKFYKR